MYITAYRSKNNSSWKPNSNSYTGGIGIIFYIYFLFSSNNSAKTWLFQSGFYPCGSHTCTLCKYAVKTKDFTSQDNKQVFKIHFLNCSATYVVYVINCTHCDLKYVGCTKRPLKKRIAEHVADISHNRTNVSGAAHHFIDRHNMSLNLYSYFMQLNVLTNPNGGVTGSKNYITVKLVGF